MTERRRSLLVVLFTVLAVVVAACGSDTEVGEGVEVESDGSDVLGALRDTTTTAPPRLTEDGGGSATTAPPATAAPTTAPPTTQAQPAIVIAIQADTAGFAFDPQVAQVPQGRIVRWVNQDSQARSVVFADNSFTTGEIPPGGHFDYVADRRGTFNYTDGTRPYAQAQLRVV